jgi:hypothetical protein
MAPAWVGRRGGRELCGHAQGLEKPRRSGKAGRTGARITQRNKIAWWRRNFYYSGDFGPGCGTERELGMRGPKLDRIDRHILRLLQAEGRITNIELARRIGISPPPCLAGSAETSCRSLCVRPFHGHAH